MYEQPHVVDITELSKVFYMFSLEIFDKPVKRFASDMCWVYMTFVGSNHPWTLIEHICGHGMVPIVLELTISQRLV